MTQAENGSTEIQPGTLYRLDDAMRRLGLGKAGFRSARKCGLKVRYMHRRGFVYGQDMIEYVITNGRAKH